VSDFVEYLHEVFDRFGPIAAKRMFSGFGLYRDGLMFALVHQDALYLKTDATNVAAFEALGLASFEFMRQGRVMKTSYYLAPAEIMEDRELAAEWARRSFEAALRVQAAKRPKAGKAKRK
jgi:DNA transformation protein